MSGQPGFRLGNGIAPGAGRTGPEWLDDQQAPAAGRQLLERQRHRVASDLYNLAMTSAGNGVWLGGRDSVSHAVGRAGTAARTFIRRAHLAALTRAANFLARARRARTAATATRLWPNKPADDNCGTDRARPFACFERRSDVRHSRLSPSAPCAIALLALASSMPTNVRATRPAGGCKPPIEIETTCSLQRTLADPNQIDLPQRRQCVTGNGLAVRAAIHLQSRGNAIDRGDVPSLWRRTSPRDSNGPSSCSYRPSDRSGPGPLLILFDLLLPACGRARATSACASWLAAGGSTTTSSGSHTGESGTRSSWASSVTAGAQRGPNTRHPSERGVDARLRRTASRRHRHRAEWIFRGCGLDARNHIPRILLDSGVLLNAQATEHRGQRPDHPGSPAATLLAINSAAAGPHSVRPAHRSP